jgi:hypothetical protein
VRITRTVEGAWRWCLSEEEWDLLGRVLDLFPLTPPDYHRLSNEISVSESHGPQHFLAESVAAHSDALRAKLQEWRAQGNVTQSLQGEVGITVKPTELEQLLQILNDIRVGSWIRLGCPEPESLYKAEPKPAQRHLFLAMEFCGLIQTRFLGALAGELDGDSE